MKIESGYTIKQLTDITNGKLINSVNNKRIDHLLTDSRQLVFPATTAFIAITTAKNNGHLYIEGLMNKGVKCFIVSELPSYSNNKKDISFILVKNTLESLHKIAAFHRQQFNIPLIAITGSNGKTIIKEWLGQLLSYDYKPVKNPKSYNSQIGVPLSVWQINNNHDIGIFEAGISQKGEMAKLQEILKPTIGIFTNIGPAHDEGFINRKEKIQEKLKLFTKTNTLIYCADHQDVAAEILEWAKNYPNIKLFSWSKKSGFPITLTKIEKHKKSTNLNIENNGEILSINIPFTDNASIENSIHCIALMLYFNYEKKSILERVLKLQPVAMRMELNQGINNSTLINDSYNSDVYSLKVALDFLASQHQHESKTIILSDILQTGIHDNQLYSQVAELIIEKQIDQLIGIGPDISAQSKLFKTKKHFYNTTEEFLLNHDFETIKNNSVLIKGARLFKFEKIISALQLKDHQTVLEINLDAMIHNLNVFKSLLKPGVKIMAMVKAFSYGSGSSEIASMLQYHNVDYLGVAYTDEGKELRKAGIKTPIMVMNPEPHNIDSLIRYKLEPEIYSFKYLTDLAKYIEHNSFVNEQNPLKIHVKIDTGMHRLGFYPDDIDKVADILKEKPSLKVKSVFSHYAASDDPMHKSFTKKQLNTFINACNKMEKIIGHGFLKHICNSAAISRYKEAHMDMVRLGIGLYGVSADPETQSLLKNISTFKSVISQVKTVPKEKGIGYNLKGKAYSATTIGIVPVGYADGLNRKLGNRVGKLLVKNKFAPIIGNICMDMCTIDITGIDALEGDEVIIFGEKYTVSQMAKDLDTIPYEILTNVSYRVKRVYCQE